MQVACEEGQWRVRRQLEGLPAWRSCEPGQRLKWLRCARGWRQLDLAERAGVGVRTVQAAEQDPDTLRGHTLTLLLTALQAPRGALWSPAPPEEFRRSFLRAE